MLRVIVIFLQLLFVICDDVLVQLPNGKIRGRSAETIKNKAFYAFEKIPYAAPPIGKLRFMAPQPPKAWEGIFNNFPNEVACFQLAFLPLKPYQQSEDCLYLNIYTPGLPNADNNSFPVMLFIHGGGFVAGTSYEYQPDWFIENDVVLVTVNYRLGIFGFLSTQDDVIPGNNGLKDQQLAIRWTHQNIQLFGGDPKKITIFGQSAGSSSVAYQLLNNKSTGFFRGAILQSGSFLTPWAFQRTARNYAFDLGSILNSTFLSCDDSKILLETLQAIDAEVLNAAGEEFFDSLLRPWHLEIGVEIPFSPVIEVKNSDAFLTRKMYQLLQAGNIITVPVLIGIVSEESLGFNQDLPTLMYTFQTLDEHLNWLVPKDMQLTNSAKAREMGMKIRDMYTGGSSFSDHIGDAIRFSTDTMFTRSIIKHAELFSRFAKTYFYQFSYHGQFGPDTVQYEGTESVSHAEELRYLFCSKSGCDLSAFPKSDQLVQERLIKMWTNFAKYRNPTPEKSELLQNITWPEVDTEKGDFLYVDINDDLQIKNHPKEKTYSKWVELYDSLGRDDFDTY